MTQQEAATEPLVLCLVDADSGDPDEPIRRATVVRRVDLASASRGWLVEIEPPFPAYRGAEAVGRAVLAESVDDLVNRGVGLTPRYRIAPVYVCTAAPPATLEQESFATGELTTAYWGDVALRPEDFPGAGHQLLPPLERLRAGLLRLEDTLRIARAPIAGYLAPGLPPEVVRERLAPAGIDPCDELLLWYGWHDGTRGNVDLGHETWALAPGVHFISLDEALKSYGRVREFLASMVDEGLAARDFWPEGGFPITSHLMGGYVDAVSCDLVTAGATWFAPWDDKPEPNGPHLADLVERLNHRWWHGAYRWDGERWVMGPEALLGMGPNVPW